MTRNMYRIWAIQVRMRAGRAARRGAIRGLIPPARGAFRTTKPASRQPDPRHDRSAVPIALPISLSWPGMGAAECNAAVPGTGATHDKLDPHDIVHGRRHAFAWSCRTRLCAGEAGGRDPGHQLRQPDRHGRAGQYHHPSGRDDQQRHSRLLGHRPHRARDQFSGPAAPEKLEPALPAGRLRRALRADHAGIGGLGRLRAAE